MSAFGRGQVSTPFLSAGSPARYWAIETIPFSVANASSGSRQYVYPFAGGARLVNVVVYQYSAGTGGTSWTLDVRNSAGTSLLTTAGVATLASGAHKVTDAKGDIALPSGWTRPVLKTDATVDIAAGGYVEIYTTESGTYSPHPTAIAVLVFEPKV